MTMIDRLRYRVWDKKNKIMYYPSIICINSTCETVDFDYKGKSVGLCWEDCVIEQCTGLKDKNNKLIYEGDAVQTHNGSLAFIKHSDDQPSFVISLTKEFSLLSNGMFSICKVIGNIHENLELIGE